MKPIIKVPVVNGLIAGVLGAIFLAGLFYMGRHPFLIPPYFDFRIFLFGFFLFFTLRELRDYYYGGLLFFWQGIVASFIFITSYALSASLLIWIFATYEQAFVTSFIELFREQVRNASEEEINQIGKDQLERNLSALESTNSFGMALQYFVQCYWIGLFLSIILSVILRRQPKT